MRNVKVTYIPENTTNETVATLVDVVRVYENMRGYQLNVEIDDTEKRNEGKVIAEITQGKIVKIELLGADSDKVDVEFTAYSSLRPINRTYYDANKQNNKIILAFFTDTNN